MFSFDKMFSRNVCCALLLLFCDVGLAARRQEHIVIVTLVPGHVAFTEQIGAHAQTPEQICCDQQTDKHIA